VALSLTMEQGWHVYWVNADDAGEPPRVQWMPVEGLAIGPMQFPMPSRLPVGPMMDYGYEGVAILSVQCEDVRRTDLSTRFE